ncbi:MAG: CAP domain-containing protein [Sporichthyaceae bacterium]
MAHTPSRQTAPHGAQVGSARAPRRTVAAFLTALAVVVTALVTGAATAAPAGASSVEDVFTTRLNHERATRGIPRLTPRAALVEVARAQARRMAGRTSLYHNPTLTSDVTNWRWVGENVGYGPDALTVHVAFMQSPAHKANILDRDYTEVGIGAVTVDGRVWVAEVFRRPLRLSTSTRRTSSGTVATFSHTLRRGSTGATVKRVQGRLHLRRTGYYGTYTRHAVARYQQAQGWRGRGNVGPKTWSRMF